MRDTISDSMNDKVAEKMRRLCSRREYCVSDIRKKLMVQLDGNAAETGEILQHLISERYIDDLRYASAYARDKASISGWGATKIRYMLSAKGNSSKAKVRLDKLMGNKFKSLKDDPQCRLKMLRFGLGRGYAYEDIASVVDALLK